MGGKWHFDLWWYHTKKLLRGLWTKAFKTYDWIDEGSHKCTSDRP